MLLTPAQATTAVGTTSLALGATAWLAPTAVARAFGVDPAANAALALLVRFVGVRNATMGAALLLADGDEEAARGIALGLVVGGFDALAATAAVRAGHLPPRSAVLAFGVIGAIAALGAVARTR